MPRDSDNKSTRTSSSAGRTSRSTSATKSTGISAEEKLKRSLKSLSHTSGGGGNIGGSSIDLNSVKSKTKTTQSTTDKTRRKVGGVVLDEATIKDANKQQLQTKSKRNNVVILVLGLLLIVSLVYLAISIAGYYNGKREPNCHYRVMGSASASWEIKESDKNDFIIASGLGPNMIYNVASTINIKTVQEVTLTLEIKASINGQEILIGGLASPHNNLLRVEGENRFIYDGTITGGGKFMLFAGIDFTDAPGELRSDNLVLEVIANVNILQ